MLNTLEDIADNAIELAATAKAVKEASDPGAEAVGALPSLMLHVADALSHVLYATGGGIIKGEKGRNGYINSVVSTAPRRQVEQSKTAKGAKSSNKYALRLAQSPFTSEVNVDLTQPVVVMSSKKRIIAHASPATAKAHEIFGYGGSSTPGKDFVEKLSVDDKKNVVRATINPFGNSTYDVSICIYAGVPNRNEIIKSISASWKKNLKLQGDLPTKEGESVSGSPMSLVKDFGSKPAENTTVNGTVEGGIPSAVSISSEAKKAASLFSCEFVPLVTCTSATATGDEAADEALDVYYTYSIKLPLNMRFGTELVLPFITALPGERIKPSSVLPLLSGAINVAFNKSGPHVFGDSLAPIAKASLHDWPITVETPKSLQAKIKHASDTLGIPNVVANPSGWAVGWDGSPRRVPTDPNDDVYTGKLLERIDDEINRAFAAVEDADEDGLGEAKYRLNLAKNSGNRKGALLIDSVHDVSYGVTASGTAAIRNIAGMRALRPAEIMTTLTMPISASMNPINKNTAIQNLTKTWSVTVYGTTLEGDTDNIGYDAQRALRGAFADVGNLAVKDKVQGLSLWDLFSNPPDVVAQELLPEGSPVSTATAFVGAVKTIQDSFAAAKERLARPGAMGPDNLDNDNSLTSMKYWIIEHAASLMDKQWRDNLSAASRSEMQANQDPAIELRPADKKTLNLKPDVAMMKHQVRCVQALSKGAPVTFLDVSMGGGKTLMLIVNALDWLAKQKSADKRVCIAAPNSLLPGFIASINRFTGGSVNALPLTLDSINALQLKSGESGIKSMADLTTWAKSFPVNTIYLVATDDFSGSKKLRGSLKDDSYASTSYGTEEIGVNPIALLLKSMNFQLFAMDEAHRIRNRDSGGRRQPLAAALAAQAEQAVYASGTMTPNRALEGTAALLHIASPFLALSSNPDDFVEAIKAGSGADPAVAARRLIDSRRRASMSIQATSEEWAFALPRLAPIYHTVTLTPHQASFYDKTLRQIAVEVAKAEKAKVNKDGGDDDEDSNMAIMTRALSPVRQLLVAPDGAPKGDKFLASHKYMELSGKDSPVKDANKIFNGKSYDNMVSPQVAKIAEIIKQRVSAGKVMVFGINKAASQHYVTHIPKFLPGSLVGEVLHYTAGDDDALNAFKTDPNKRILICDITSMSDGHDLQVAATIIRTQLPWTIGEEDQPLARMFRPDFTSSTIRNEIEYHIIYTVIEKSPNPEWETAASSGGSAPSYDENGHRPTVDAIVLARLASEQLAQAGQTYGDDRANSRRALRWEAFRSSMAEKGVDLDSIVRFKMDADTLISLSMKNIKRQIAARQGLNDFREEINADNRKSLQEYLNTLPDKPQLIDPSTGDFLAPPSSVMKYILQPAGSQEKMPGSRIVYTPWLAMAAPPDPHGIGLIEHTSEDIDADRRPKVGSAVMTEFGPAIVTQVNKAGGITGLETGVHPEAKDSKSKTAAAKTNLKITADLAINIGVARTAAGEAKIKAMFEAAQGFLLPPGAKTTKRATTLASKTVKPPKGLAVKAEEVPVEPKAAKAKGEAKAEPTVEAEEPPAPKPARAKRATKSAPKPKEEEASEDTVIQPSIINGLPCLVFEGVIKKAEKLPFGPQLVWHEVSPHVAYGGTSPQVTKFMKALAANGDIPVDIVAHAADTLKRFGKGAKAATGLTADQRPTPAATRAAIVDLTRPRLPPAAKNDSHNTVFKPIVCINDNSLRVLFLTKSHKAAAMTKIRGVAASAGVKLVQDMSKPFCIAFLPTAAAATAVGKQVAAHMKEEGLSAALIKQTTVAMAKLIKLLTTIKPVAVVKSINSAIPAADLKARVKADALAAQGKEAEPEEADEAPKPKAKTKAAVKAGATAKSKGAKASSKVSPRMPRKSNTKVDAVDAKGGTSGKRANATVSDRAAPAKKAAAKKAAAKTLQPKAPARAVPKAPTLKRATLTKKAK